VGGIHMKAPGARHFYDTVVGINQNGKASMLFNFDYGVDKNPISGNSKFYGFSILGRAIANDTFSFSPRYDWYKDKDGFITGTARTIQEFTMTGDVKLRQGFLMRLEYRRDWADVNYFDRGNGTGNAKNQSTVLLGFVVFFGPKS
jgi:hypothetical protein